MKKNLAVVCLSNVYARRIGKKLADSLDMFFVDINDILEYNLVNNDMIKNSGKEYFDMEQKKVIENICEYENALIVGSFEIFFGNENIQKLKKNSIIIYLQFDEKTLLLIDKKYSLLEKQRQKFASGFEEQIAIAFSDFKVQMCENDEKNLKNIKQNLLSYCKR